MANRLLLDVPIRRLHDVVAVRRGCREVAARLGFAPQDQVRIATAASEMARIAMTYANGGSAALSLADGPPAQMTVTIGGHDPGFADALDGTDSEYESVRAGACRLVDDCRVEARRDGAAIVLEKALPAGLPADAGRVAAADASRAIDAFSVKAQPGDGTDELQRQNRELLQALAELNQRQDELRGLTRELEETNRGVVALYAEIEEKAERLRQADAMKSRFLSNTSHELRTPLSSIRALSQLLLDRIDGELSAEQERQVRFIQNAAIDLSELVDGLLDLAKIESGKIAVHRATFSLAELFGALRGMLRPLASNAEVALLFEVEPAGALLHTDEGKLAQILRNLVANALKFTEHGTVTVSAQVDADGAHFSVTDTGIGIAHDDLQRIFEEFEQVRNPLQRAGKGTGLGLPLSRSLAALLGGTLSVESAPGKGSTFTLRLPTDAIQPAGAGTSDGAPLERP